MRKFVQFILDDFITYVNLSHMVSLFLWSLSMKIFLTFPLDQASTCPTTGIKNLPLYYNSAPKANELWDYGANH